MKVFLSMMVVQFISYLNLVVNYRAIAKDMPLVAMVTDGLAVVISILIVQRIANPEVPVRWGWQENGMVVGGSLAALAGLHLTRTWT